MEVPEDGACVPSQWSHVPLWPMTAALLPFKRLGGSETHARLLLLDSSSAFHHPWFISYQISDEGSSHLIRHDTHFHVFASRLSVHIPFALDSSCVYGPTGSVSDVPLRIRRRLPLYLDAPSCIVTCLAVKSNCPPETKNGWEFISLSRHFLPRLHRGGEPQSEGHRWQKGHHGGSAGGGEVLPVASGLQTHGREHGHPLLTKNTKPG